MNLQNLQAMADHIRTVDKRFFSVYGKTGHHPSYSNPPNLFDYGLYGHCEHLYGGKQIMRKYDGFLLCDAFRAVHKAVEAYTGIAMDSEEWRYINDYGGHNESFNDPESTALRIETVITTGVPNKEQMMSRTY